MRSPVRYGFTLIELLVVITIIAVLLAMLVPALDRAVYQAQLVVCAAQQRTSMGGIQTYAMDHKRFYPYKPAVHSTNAIGIPSYLSQPGGRASTAATPGSATPVGGGYDSRIYYEPYVNYAKLFLDPMAGYVDLTPKGNDYDANILSSYVHLDGWVFYKDFNKTQTVGAAMSKVGSYLSWTELVNGKPLEHRYTLLIADVYSNSYADAGGATSGHPDQVGGGDLNNRQNSHAGNPTPPSFPGSGAQSWKGTYSHYNYFNQNAGPHGLMDLNFGFQDGSVRQVKSVGRAPRYVPGNLGSYPLSGFPLSNEEITYPNVGSDPGYWLLEGQ